MSSEVSRSSSPRSIAAAARVFADVVVGCAVIGCAVIGCVGPDSFNRDAGPLQTGAGGNDGFAGQTGTGGSGLGGAAAGGQTGAGGSGVGGKTGAGGTGMGGALGAGGGSAGGRTGSGGSGMGGAPGVGGRGMGGAPAGMGGALATDGGNDGDGAGVDGNGAGGMTGMGGASGCPPGIYCDNFESYATGGQPPTWTRLGGSAGDFQVVLDGSQVLAQNKTATGTTYRACYASGAPGAPWSNATTISAQVKVTAVGVTPTALLCVRYTTQNTGYCLALLPSMGGAQIQVRAADVASNSGDLTAMPIVVGTQYNVQVSVDGAGVLSGSVNGTAVAPFTPPGAAITAGFVGVATQMAEATFDNVVVTQP